MRSMGLWSCGLALCVLSLAHAPAGAETTASPPNILFLLADDLGWVDASTPATSLGHNSRYHETPRIDRLAAQGMSFTAADTQQNCAPSRVAFLTGQYAPRTGVYSVGMRTPAASRILPPKNLKGVPPASITIAETLRGAGYRRVHLGKAQVYGRQADYAADHGIEVARPVGKQVHLEVAGGGSSSPYCAARGADGEWSFGKPDWAKYAAPYTRAYVTQRLVPFANGNDPQTLVGTPKHLTDAVADAAIEVIAESVVLGQPFFVNVSFHAVHPAVRPRPDLATKYAAKPSGDPRHQAPDYAAFVEGLDQSVGRIVAALDDPNGDGDASDSIAGNTLVIFASDNGGGGRSDNTPLRGIKGSFAEGGIRVPWIVRLPGVIPVGAVSHEPIHAIDFYPTAAELAGAKLPDPAAHPLDGESLLPILRGDEKQLARDALFWQYPGYASKKSGPHSVISRRVGSKRYKLFYHYDDQRFQLFELSADLGEANDLLAGSASAESRQRAAELSAELRAWLEALQVDLGRLRATRERVLPPDAG
jgi:arylsulfatase A-like enzyme